MSLYAKKDFMQFKRGDLLPSGLDARTIKGLKAQDLILTKKPKDDKTNKKQDSNTATDPGPAKSLDESGGDS